MFKTVRIALVIAASGVTFACAQPGAIAPSTSAAVSAVEAQRGYKIEDTLGIGPVYGTKLRGIGVSNTDKLLARAQTRNERKKLAEEAGVPYRLLLAWAQKTEIMNIHGIGPRGANLLNAVLVQSVKDLAHRDPVKLHERLAIANTFEPKFMKYTPSLATVTRWVEAAKSQPTAISDDRE